MNEANRSFRAGHDLTNGSGSPTNSDDDFATFVSFDESDLSGSHESEDEFESLPSCEDSVASSRSDKEPSATFDDLPNEVILKILDFLPRRELLTSVRRVSRTLSDLTIDSSLWHRVTFDSSYKADDIARVISRFKDSIRSVKLQAGEDLTETLINLITSGIALEEVIIDQNKTSVSLNDSFLLFQLSRRLRALSLNSFKLPSIPEDFPFNTLPRLSLVSLELYQCSQLRDAEIQVIVSCCPRLELLNIDFVEHLSNESLVAIADGLQQLRALYIDGEDIDDYGYEYFLRKKPKLSAFGVSFARQMGDRSFSLFKRMSNLQYLKVRHGDLLTKEGIQKTFVRGHFPLLKTLNLDCTSEVDGAGTKAIALACPNLEWFAAGCSSIDDESISFLIDSCPKLSVVQITGCILIDGENWLENIGAKLPRLQYVDLTMCRCPQETVNRIEIAHALYPKVHIAPYYCTCDPHQYSGLVELSMCTFMQIVSENPSLSDIKNQRSMCPDIVAEAVRRELAWMDRVGAQSSSGSEWL